MNACTADLDEQGVVQNTTISLYRVEADMTETPMQIRLIERYTDLLEPVPDAETKEDIVRSYRKRLPANSPGILSTCMNTNMTTLTCHGTGSGTVR